MAETGENYTTVRRMVIAGRDPGQPPEVLRVYLNPHVDLELTGKPVRLNMVKFDGSPQGRKEVKIGPELSS
jgi:hypothetical protein